MNLIIDNNDGLGGVDYTAAVLNSEPLTLRRRRGQWSECCAGLDVATAGLPLPLSRARVLVSDSAGGILFQGFLRQDALLLPADVTRVSVGLHAAFVAVEQHWLTGAEPDGSLQPAASATHSFNAGNVTLALEVPSPATSSQLATDVTVAGELEATEYVTELFRGDGTTQTFSLAHAPFREAGSETLVSDSFDDAVLSPATWTRTDPGNYLKLGAGGLQMTGGNGADGATLLQLADPVELGGTLVAEADNVVLVPGSDGLLMGFYSGAVSHANCVAGIRVNGVAGAQTLMAVVNGAEQAVSYGFAAGHSYALRVRLHSPELQRQRQSYQALADGVVQTFGGSTVAAPLHLVVEALDLGLASSTPATVLFDGAIAASPSFATFAPVNSTQLTGSVGAVSLKQTGSAWVVSTTTGGTTVTRREGAAGTGADYALSSAGTGADYALSSAGVITFDSGRQPQPGELVTVTYRRGARAKGRLQDASAQQVKLQLALPGLPAWSGSVLKPTARSSADCIAAAQALLAQATSASAGSAGTVVWTRISATGADIAPGDTLAVQTGAGQQMLSVQEVEVTAVNTLPEILHYRTSFAQRRAEALGFTVEDREANDVAYPLPVDTVTSTAPSALAGLVVTSATTAALQIDSGADAPSGGGFEVRRSDANFGSADTSDLVLNSPVRSFSIPRLAFRERFFVRMFDGSVTRQYSPTSSVVLTSLPTS